MQKCNVQRFDRQAVFICGRQPGCRNVGNDGSPLFSCFPLGLANKTCHWNTGVMVADNGPLYDYVDIPLKIFHFQLQ